MNVKITNKKYVRTGKIRHCIITYLNVFTAETGTVWVGSYICPTYKVEAKNYYTLRYEINPKTGLKYATQLSPLNRWQVYIFRICELLRRLKQEVHK